VTDSPLVTIVTPSYNQADFLERTILSVLKQDYPNIEYIVIDGGSTDGSVDIIKKYEDRIAFWISEPDNGQSQAINKGFTRANGEIFNWLNSDDLLMPSATTIAVHYLTTHPEYGMVYGDRVVVNERDQVMACTELPSFSRFFYKFRSWLPQETAFFRQELWAKTGGLDESLHNCMDGNLWLEFLKETDFLHIPFVLGAWRQHSCAKSFRAFGKYADDEKGFAESRNMRARHLGRVYRCRHLQKWMRRAGHFRLFRQKLSKARKQQISKINELISQRHTLVH